jgi:hypothetical protein
METMSLSADSVVDTRHLEGARAVDASPEPARFLHPAVSRIITGAGFPGGHVQQALRHHSSVARRIVLGRQILNIIEKSGKSL